jgi:hypothetical protein
LRGLCLAAGLAALLPAWPAYADGRRKDVTPPSAQTRLLPAATAPAGLAAPVLTGLDYSAVAPPGTFLRVIENEPYTYMLGTPGRCPLTPNSGVTFLTLLSQRSDGGSFEADITLAYTKGRGCTNELITSFDTAADSAYKAAAVAREERGPELYGLDEVRSTLGLNTLQDARGRSREYLAYSALAANPLGTDFANRATPYRSVTGKLQCLRGIERDCYLLSIDFKTHDFPHSLTLTENIARCILNRLSAATHQRDRLEYLTYYPEFELPGLDAVLNGQPLDPRTADLAERPGEGVGIDPLPIQGDLCPQPLGEGPAWPAAPYQDTRYWNRLGLTPQTAPRCSHCLLDSPVYLRRYLPPDTQWRVTHEKKRPAPRNAAAPAPAPCTAKCGPGSHPSGGTVQVNCRPVCRKQHGCRCQPKCTGCNDGLELAQDS